MTHVALSKHVEVARGHLGDRAPLNTCVQLGMRAWPAELGLEDLDTDSVSEAERRARDGYKGWGYRDGTRGLQPGHYGDWTRAALGASHDNPDPRHVCVIEHVDGDRFRGIGAGTPSGTVAYQPAGGGTNPVGVLRGYFIPPTETPHAAPAPVAPKPAAAHTSSSSSSKSYTVVKGDTVDRIAERHNTSRQAILRANPAGSSRSVADFRIIDANRIYVGQRLHLP